MDRLDSMRVFARIVEQKSFSAAARDLGLPASTVTDAVQQLERRLGVRLLQRTTRHVSPTLDGEAYYQRCLRILDEIEDAEGAFSGAQPKGILRVETHSGLARRILLPGLPRFLAQYPGIELHLSEGDRFVDLVREGFDCVLRVGTVQDSDLVARRMAMMEEVTAASPDYIARHGMPARWDRLEGHRMIGFRSSATGGVLPLEFMVGGVLKTAMLPMTLSVNAAGSYRAAARQGFGLIQVPRYALERDFAQGALVPVLEDTPPSPTPVSLLYPQGRQLSPRLRVFIAWLMQEFAAQTMSR
jgi:DNA-binding transcriptional LysR family regulator